MNYLKYWKLERPPFQLGGQAVPSNKMMAFFDQGTVEEAIARIHFLIQSRRRLGTIVGPSGVGKSRLVRQFCSSPTYASKVPGDYRLHYVSVGGWSANRFYRWVSCAIGQRTDSCDLYQSAMDSVDGFLATQGTLVLMIDDCDLATDEACVAIGELLNRSKRLTILIAANSVSSVSRPTSALSSLHDDQVVTAGQGRGAFSRLASQSQLRIDLPAWGLGQAADYFSMMLESVGGRSAIFEAQAITRIHELSNGLVRQMNQIADLSLVAAAARKFSRVPSEIVDQICEELGLIASDSEHNWTEISRFAGSMVANGAKF